ncbi:alpha/beta fold family hydrolase [Isoalcanivorax pacificus W11-5]|uniref:Alpha/beta fold family hydrolase n=1 Tax=Isoalcanivorax pacificus W11-5 TaxID=391936 RepID=A0A0B4XJZ2_9GAMM|nr:triacylglycerol lipase [Isoalcanivorax pacificus]AJD48589.1 alpha/beta fold family hydrolase [Isoalcanivorax pacificus W11-5]
MLKRLPVLLCACLCLTLSLPASAFFGWLKDTYTETRYPIVLVHGLFGFDSLLGVDYFYGVPGELQRSGARVFVAQVAAANSTEVRGEQLARQVEAILAATGAQKVNLIGHSHGGPTIRYVASVYPHMVASASSVAGVNWGAPMADVLQGVSDHIPLGDDVINGLGNTLAGLINLLSGGGAQQDISAAMKSLTTADTLRFNALYPEGMPSRYCGAGQEVGSNGVRYYSWSGGRTLTNLLDVTDPFMAALSIVFLGEKNDGLVSSCSSHLGKIIRDDYRMNHLDEVNQAFGLRDIFETSPVTVFRQQANRLKNAGL